MTRRTAWRPAAVLALMLGTVPPAVAYTRIVTPGPPQAAVTWDLDGTLASPTSVIEGEVVYSLAAAGSADVTDGSDLEAIAMAFRTWSGVTASSLRFRRGADLTGAATTLDDGVLPVFWLESGTVVDQGTATLVDDVSIAGALAVTFVYSEATGPDSGTIVDANIVLNGAEFSWTTRPESEPTRYDIRSVATHEIGHALGLGHSPVASATMFPRLAAGTVRWRSLAADDVAGLIASYPGDGGLLGRGRVRGSILRDGEPVAGGLVWVTDGSGLTAASSLTDATGQYVLDGLHPGTYALFAGPAGDPTTFSLFSEANLSAAQGPLDRGFGTTSGQPVRVRRGRSTTRHLTVAAGLPALEIRLLGRSSRWSNASTILRRGEIGIWIGAAGPGLSHPAAALYITGGGIVADATSSGSVAGLPSISWRVSVSPDALPGPRDLVVITPDGRATAIGGVEVLLAEGGPGIPDTVPAGGADRPLTTDATPGTLELVWSAPARADWYHLYAGDLAGLRTGVHDDAPVERGCHLAVPEASLPLATLPTLAFFLPTGANVEGEGGRGKDGAGGDRPDSPNPCP